MPVCALHFAIGARTTRTDFDDGAVTAIREEG